MNIASTNSAVYFVKDGELMYSGNYDGNHTRGVTKAGVSGVKSIVSDWDNVYCQLGSIILRLSTDGNSTTYPVNSQGLLTNVKDGCLIFSHEDNTSVQEMNSTSVITYPFNNCKMGNRMVCWTSGYVHVVGDNVIKLDTFSHDIISVKVSDEYVCVLNSRGHINVFHVDDDMNIRKLEKLREGIDCSDLSARSDIVEFHYTPRCMIFRTYTGDVHVDVDSLGCHFKMSNSGTITSNSTRYPIFEDSGNVFTLVREGPKLIRIDISIAGHP